jgi:hypothetical protein
MTVLPQSTSWRSFEHEYSGHGKDPPLPLPLCALLEGAPPFPPELLEGAPPCPPELLVDPLWVIGVKLPAAQAVSRAAVRTVAVVFGRIPYLSELESQERLATVHRSS